MRKKMTTAHDFDGNANAHIAHLQAERDQLAANLETARKALEAIRATYYNQQISTLHVSVTMCAFAQEALAQIAKPAALEERDRAVLDRILKMLESDGPMRSESRAQWIRREFGLEE